LGQLLFLTAGAPPRIASLPVLFVAMVIFLKEGMALEAAAASEPADTVVMNRRLVKSLFFIMIDVFMNIIIGVQLPFRDFAQLILTGELES
jgi:hypothetical protein